MPPPATDRCGGGIMFSSCPSVRASVARPVSTNKWTEFHQTLFDDVVEATDELVRFEGRRVNVKVTARSNICMSYCSGRRHPHRPLDVEVSSVCLYNHPSLPCHSTNNSYALSLLNVQDESLRYIKLRY